jgi:hypothetical protein
MVLLRAVGVVGAIFIFATLSSTNGFGFETGGRVVAGILAAFGTSNIFVLSTGGAGLVAAGWAGVDGT